MQAAQGLHPEFEMCVPGQHDVPHCSVPGHGRLHPPGNNQGAGKISRAFSGKDGISHVVS